MNSMLKVIIPLLLSLLLMVAAGHEEYTSVKTQPRRTPVTSYQQTQHPCKKTMDYLFTNRFADMPQIIVTLDNPDSSSKSKCVLRLLATISEFYNQKLQVTHISYHSYSAYYYHAIDYYVYALRRIII